MKVYLYLLTMFLGVILAVHLAMNSKVGSILANPRVGNALFWCIGALGAAVIGASGWQDRALQPLKQVHPLLLTAGVLGAALVFGVAWLIPQIGAGPVKVTMLIGQVSGGIIVFLRMFVAGQLSAQLKRPVDPRSMAALWGFSGGYMSVVSVHCGDRIY